ncbi:hypothetical protein BJ508DRAFT_330670 [Ascobolus immersus RN42]|uniref:Uncharacterized protein n=1 Tax=Ascobolus immersus RN42 TaxID=1160509 RepID=A0A3N4HY66_ASCIM|nr:hypothetical protein BJ508DRAFT_330670 [Ascobolus immersus RN42]
MADSSGPPTDNLRRKRGSTREPPPRAAPPPPPAASLSQLDPITSTPLSQPSIQVPSTQYSDYGQGQPSYDPVHDQLRRQQTPSTVPTALHADILQTIQDRHDALLAAFANRIEAYEAKLNALQPNTPSQPTVAPTPPAPPPVEHPPLPPPVPTGPPAGTQPPPPPTSHVFAPPPPPTPLGPIHHGEAPPLLSQPFSAPTAVQLVLPGHIAGLDARAVTAIFNGTFRATDLAKLQPDHLRNTYNLQEDRLYLCQDEHGNVVSTNTPPNTTVKEKLAPYVNTSTFARYWMIYTHVMASLFGSLSPNLIYGLNLHLYNLLYRNQSNLWTALLNYHFTHHQALLDDGHHSLLSPDSWTTFNTALEHHLLSHNTLRTSSIPGQTTSSSSTAKPSRNGTASSSTPRTFSVEEMALQYCYIWNDPKKSCPGGCGRRHECENCDSKDHKTFKCPVKPVKARVQRLLAARS